MLKVFEKFSKEQEILDWLIKFDINFSSNEYTISVDGVIDVAGNVDISEKNLESVPYKFGEVTGDFDCYFNKLTSLQGFPSSVGGDFYCHRNQLTSLQYAPSSVGGDFWCGNNQLTSLQYAPASVGGSFSCVNNQLTNLQYAPASVGGDFSCSKNKFRNLGDLVGLPKFIGGDFNCGIPEETIFGYKLVGDVIAPNYDIFKDMNILYEEAGEKYYQPNALRGFIRQESPSYLTKINLKEIENKFREIGYTII
jgi:hypothetical protein